MLIHPEKLSLRHNQRKGHIQQNVFLNAPGIQTENIACYSVGDVKNVAYKIIAAHFGDEL